MFHGNLYYAIKSRDVSTFGGRASKSTIKIYLSRAANSPAAILDQPAQIAEFTGLIEDCGNDRQARDSIMAEFVKFGG